MVDLGAAPFNLSESAIKWVNQTIADMSDEEKLGQLFVNMGAQRSEEYLSEILDNYHIGAVRYNPGTAEEVWEQNRILQTKSKIPLLIAANTEAGGNGACTDGTYVGCEIKVGATNDERFAYELGRVSGIEAAAIGCNWSFAPIVDLLYNWRNPVIADRAFGNDPDLVLKMARAYIRGISESGILPAAKHFPGDGIDERDQHLSASVNTLSCEEWDATYGKVYQGLIDDGLPSIMAGHIMLPSYQRHFSAQGQDVELRPATLCKELLTDLLRGKMGFNGLIVTDASHMVGMTGEMARRDMLPAAIEAGCDLFLFFNDPDEDFAWMKEAYRDGRLSHTRVEAALQRILGLKAKLGLHEKPREEILPPKEAAMARIGMAEALAVAPQVSDAAITLVKEEDGVLPVTPPRYPRVLVVPVSGPKNPVSGAFGGGGAESHPAAQVAKLLAEQGFEVTVHESLFDKLEKMTPEEQMQAVKNVYAGKAPIAKLTEAYDLVLLIARVEGMLQPVARVMWPATKGTVDIPWYVHEIPTIYVSTASAFDLADVPQVKTYINTYDFKDHTLSALVDKLQGKSEFRGISPVDAFCGLEEARR